MPTPAAQHPRRNLRAAVPRRLVGVCILLAALVVSAYAAFGGFAFDVRISSERMNAAIAAKLPMARRAGLVAWEVDRATLTVLEHGRIGVDAELRGRARRREATAHMSGSAVLTYRDGAFWLGNVDLQRLDHIVVWKTDAAEDDTHSGTFSEGLVKDPRVRAALGDMGEALIREALKYPDLALNAIFALMPVYRLQDDVRGNVARLVLVSVRTDGQDVIARIDPLGEALKTIALSAMLVLLLYDALGFLVLRFGILRSLEPWLYFWW